MKRGVLFLIIGVVVVVTVLLILIFNANKQVAPSEKTLVVWSPFSEEETYQKISARFLESNPTVKIEFKYIDAKDAKEYEATVVNEIADGNGPDIWLVRSDWIPKHAAKSTPLEPANKEDNPIANAKGYIEPALVDLNTVDGKLYGIPMSADSLALIYNSSLYGELAQKLDDEEYDALIKAPQTWADVVAQSALVTQKNGSAVSRSGLATGTIGSTIAPVDVLSALLLQHGSSILTEDKKEVAFNLAQVKSDQTLFPATNALNFYTSFSRAAETNYSWAENSGDPIEAFVAQKATALIGYYSTVQAIEKANPSFRYDIAPLPQLSTEGSRTDFAVTWSHIVSANSSNSALAWSYIRYLAAQETQFDYGQATNKLPVSNVGRNADLSGGVAQRPSTSKSIFTKQFRNAKQLYKPEWQKADEILQDAVTQVVSLGQAPQTSVDSAAQRFKEFVSN
jgi:ABC-type glycerol-3-phosphate transport system substrate-binding protein